MKMPDKIDKYLSFC